MRRRYLRSFWILRLLVLGSAAGGFFWFSLKFYSNSGTEENPQSHLKKTAPVLMPQICREKSVENFLKVYSQDWIRQDDHITLLRSELNSKCNGVFKAIVTQTNSPLGSNITYDADKRIAKVTPKLFDTFVKDSPFVNKTFKTCSVVGNGGVLVNSSCGEEIDSAQFVIRCNLAPMGSGYRRDVGTKTNLVTSNPSILLDKFGSLMESRRPFVERLGTFGDSLVLFPTFSYGQNTAVSLRALYTLHDFESPAQPVFMNPEYLRNLAQFWETRGLMKRLSTGMMMTSLALELCDEVHLYGFWPYPQHPRDCRSLTNHYYDDMKPKSGHAMPVEFNRLLQLHSLGRKADLLAQTQSMFFAGRLTEALRQIVEILLGGIWQQAIIDIKCNLAPLDKGYKRRVGTKTNFVTSNPSILVKFGSLMERRRPFVERLDALGDSLVLFSTFSYPQNTAVSLRALYSLHDFQSPL